MPPAPPRPRYLLKLPLRELTGHPTFHTQITVTNSQNTVEEPGRPPAGGGASALQGQQRSQEGLVGEDGPRVRQGRDDEVEDLLCEGGCQDLLREGCKNLLPNEKKKRKLVIKSKHAVHKTTD